MVFKSSPLECINNVTTHDDKPIEIEAFGRAASIYYQQMDDQPIIPNWPTRQIKERSTQDWNKWWLLVHRINRKEPGSVDFIHRLNLRHYTHH